MKFLFPFCFIFSFLCSYRSVLSADTRTITTMQTNLNNQDLAQITLKWDPKNLEIKTRSVERTLEPLVIQVNAFVK